MMYDSVLFWLIVLSGFYMAWSIGANDVANAMGTSVGSGALRLRQALFIAAILEFSGAFFFGSHVSETMQKGIIHADIFASDPMTLLLGMLSALIGTGVWLQLASYFGWPVSTTHTIVGAIIGFALIFGGIEAVNWGNVLFIASSWVLSPLIGALFGYGVFQLIRRKIFFTDHPLNAAKYWMPYLVFAVILALTLLLLLNGLDNVELSLSTSEIFLIAFLFGGLAFLLTRYFVSRFSPQDRTPSADHIKQAETQLKAAREELAIARKEQNSGALIHELEETIHALEHSKKGENYKADFITIEKMFGWLQILSACLMAFAHGANDVANAIGPLSAALYILETGTVSFAAEVPAWALALGGFGIVVGLATWGWRVIETVGKKITELTPTRGFSAEFGAAVTILIASRLGLPISTTHTLVGAVIGVGLARGIGALNLGMTRDIVISWMVTIPAGAITAIVVFLFLSLFF